MKRLFFALLFALAFTSGLAQLPPKLLSDWWPTYSDENYPYLSDCVPQSQPQRNSPIHTERHVGEYSWRDLQCTIKDKIPGEIWARLKMMPQNGNYYLVPITVGEYVTSRTVLATYTTTGDFIDQLEAGFITEGYGKWLYIKSFRVDRDMKVTVYYLKVTDPTPLTPAELPSIINTQRFDITYRISSDGRFQKTGEKAYQPKAYTEAELNVEYRNVWDGNEVPVETNDPALSADQHNDQKGLSTRAIAEARKLSTQPTQTTMSYPAIEQGNIPAGATICDICAGGSHIITKTKKVVGRKNDKRTIPANAAEPEMVFVEGGTFQMGSAENDGGPTHSVTVSSFYIGKYEITQAQWKAMIGADNNPSAWKGDNLPVETVNWKDVQEFIARLNAATGKKYRLPTTDEWEYAARGGNQSRSYDLSGSNSVYDVAWFNGNSGGRTQPVGTKLPNELGIHDMSGNVEEWCEGWSDSTHTFRTLRGGHVESNGAGCLLDFRAGYSWPESRDSNVGFRLVLVP